MPPPKTQTIRNGAHIRYLKPGQLIGSKRANALIAVANAILKGTVTHGSPSGLFWSDNNLILQVDSALGGNGVGTSYRGEFELSNLEPYTAGDIVRLSNSNIVFAASVIGYSGIGNARPGTYVCVKGIDPLTAPKTGPFPWPQFPEPASPNRYWELIGGLKHFRGEYMQDPHDATNPNPGIIGQTGGFGEPDYVVGDIVAVSNTNAFLTAQTVPGLYLCKQNSPGPLQQPVHSAVPSPSFYLGYAYWQLLSTWPSITNVCDSDGASIEVYADQQEPPT